MPAASLPESAARTRINAADHSQQTIAVYPQVPLDAPLSLAFGTSLFLLSFLPSQLPLNADWL